MAENDEDRLKPLKTPDIGGAVVLSARQVTLRDFLERSKPGLGSIYYGVIHALVIFRNPENVVQAAHSARELIRKLHEAFPGLPDSGSKGEAYVKLAEISTLFQQNPTDRDLRNKVAEIDKWYAESQISRRQRYAAMIDKINQGRSPVEQDKNRAARDLIEYQDWLSSIAHHGREVAEAEFRNRLDSFESTLEILLTGYFDIEKNVERLIALPFPTEDDLASLQQLFLRSAVTEYFFRNVSNPCWLSLLRSAGYFVTPIDILIHPDGGVSCPSWPQSSYLMKCAASVPSEVADILDTVNDNQNSRVHQELVETALKLPSKMILTFSKKAKNWIRDQYHTITRLPDKLAELAAKLAEEGQRDVAFEVADTILDVWIDGSKYERQKKSLGFDLAPDAEAYVDDWRYKRLLEHCTPLCTLDHLRFMALICNKLTKAIRLEHEVRGYEEETSDYTYIARPAIEQNKQNSGTDRLKDALIDEIRDQSAGYVQSGGSIESLFGLLREYKYPVFRRLELHLMSEFPENCLGEVADVLTQQELFDDVPTHHERYRLLEKAFGMLPDAAQQIYLKWVASGPDIESYKKRVEEESGSEPTNEQAQDYSKRWKLRRYAPIAKHLGGESRTQFETLSGQVSVEEHPEFLTYSTSWVGPTSPIDSKQLSAMDVTAVMDYLSSWQPPRAHYAPSPEGLGRFLKDDVRARGPEYSAMLDKVNPIDLRPVYLYYMFSGLEDSVKDSKLLQWSKILMLAEKIVLSENLPEPDISVDDFETSWVGVRKEIASLLSESLRKPHIVPFESRQTVWRTIARLCHDSEPGLEYEARYGGSNSSPVDLSINTVRGEAVHGLFQYLLWVDQNINEGIEHDKQNHEIPAEALAMLGRLLDPSLEPTLTIRSVVGWYLQYLAYLDLNWTKEHIDYIVPTSDEGRTLAHAAFEGYFSFNQPNGYLFRNLRLFYERAFAWANDPKNDDRFHRPRQNYIDHLLHFYWWGVDPLENADCLIRRVFETGNLKLRTHAIESAGRSLERLLPIVPGGPEALRRLQELLEWRIEQIRSKQVPEAEASEELREFGWWFTYAQMDHRWLLDGLSDILDLTKGRIEWTHKVLERLTEFISMDPLAVAQAADKIVRADASPWNLDYWQEQLRPLFEGVKKSSNSDAWVTCVATINFLGEKGIRSFRDLL